MESSILVKRPVYSVDELLFKINAYGFSRPWGESTISRVHLASGYNNSHKD